MEYRTNVYSSYDEFMKRENFDDNGVSAEFAEAHPNHKEENITNVGCWNCSFCIACRYSTECVRCNNSIDLHGQEDLHNKIGMKHQNIPLR